MRFKRHGPDRKPELNLASMIDATFLLLSFFIFTTGQGQNEARLSPNLRVQRGTDAKDDLEPQVLEVQRADGKADGKADGRVVFKLGSSTLATREELQAALRALPHEKGLFVRVSGGVDVGTAAAAIQCARDSGFEAVTYVPAK